MIIIKWYTYQNEKKEERKKNIKHKKIKRKNTQSDTDAGDMNKFFFLYYFFHMLIHKE